MAQQVRGEGEPVCERVGPNMRRRVTCREGVERRSSWTKYKPEHQNIEESQTFSEERDHMDHR